MEEIIKKVKENKKYKSLSDDIIKKEIKEYLEKNKTLNINQDLSADKQAIKDIREQLHKSYSSFQTKKKNKREQYLNDLRQAMQSNNPQLFNESLKNLLSITISAKERLNFYPEIYDNIFLITKEPKTILDLASGLNPLSFTFMNLPSLNYHAYDIDEEDIKFLNNYFEIMKSKGLSGKAEILDITNMSKIKSLPNSDIIFLFKIIDLIDFKSHKPSEELIKILMQKTKFLVASFATKTLTNRNMNFPERKWFELMLSRNNLRFQSFKTPNELFYVINK